MSIYGSKKILTVGRGADFLDFLKIFKAEGLTVIRAESIKEAYVLAQEEKPDGFLFILPRFWTELSDFVEKIRKVEGFEHTPIVYVGGLIEGNDQAVLKSAGVSTFTLGPVPTKEMARFVIDEMSKFRF